MARINKIQKYGMEWNAATNPVAMEIYAIRQGGKWKNKKGEGCGLGLFQHYKNFQMLVWPEDYHHRWSDLELQEILNNTITIVTGPKDCVAGHTKILNPITGEEPTIQELCESGTAPMVMTLKGPVQAEVPFLKGEKELFEVTCDDGSKFTATANHAVLTSSGFSFVKSLSPGSLLFSYVPVHHESNLEPYPAIREQDDQSFLKKEPSSQSDCQMFFRSYDERLQMVKALSQCFSPSQGDAPLRNHCYFDSDDYRISQERNHSYQKFDPLSNLRFSPHSSTSENVFEFPPFSENHESAAFLFQSYEKAPLLKCQFSKAQEEALCFDQSFLIDKPFQSSFQDNPSFLNTNESLPQIVLEHNDEHRERNDIHSNICLSSGLLQDRKSLPSLKYMIQQKLVQEIKSVGVGKYYDITVPEIHHYFAEGSIHHNTGKTHVALVRYGLTDYFCFPDETLIIVSSTGMRELEGRVWGDMKSMFQKAKLRCPFLPGHPLESKHAIVTDDLSDDCDIVRDMRKGILCIAAKNSAGSFVSMAAYVGMKQKRRRHLGDEFQFMGPAMMESISNMNSGDYKGVFTGNPIGQGDPLDQMSEPECGWDSFPDPVKTTTWKNRRFLNSRTICLYGPDSPTYDFQDEPDKYPGLISQDGIDRVVAGYGKDSHQYYSQCLGIRKSGLNARRVITKDLCRKFSAFEPVVWGNGRITKVCATDVAYGGIGGDRCIGGHGEFGMDVSGKSVLAVYPPVIVPVSIKNKDMSPEDQISTWSKTYCESFGISPDSYFYDSTGRGSLGPSLARIWSPNIQPVEFGGTATDRPVSLDIFIIDPKTGRKRLKTCKEHYSKFVTELWWSTRYAIESSQIRGLPEKVADEGCQREWKEVSGGRIEVETKSEMKSRTGESPDYYDWFVTLLEGARRKGFQISKLGNAESEEDGNLWFHDLKQQNKDLNRKNTLVFN